MIANTAKGKIEFTSVGSGLPILFVHGGHGNCNETLFHKGYDTNRFHLITPSRPGYGQTPLAISSPKETAALFVSLLDELKIEMVIAIGISAGGLTAIELAANYPNRVSKLILISAVTKRWLSIDDAMYKKGRKIFKPSIEKYSWPLFKFFYFMFPNRMAKVMFKELSTGGRFDITKEEVKELQMMIGKQRSFQGFVNDLDQTIHEGTISKIICPTLMLHSTNDNVVKIEHAIHAQHTIKNSILKLYNTNGGICSGLEMKVQIQSTMR